MQATKSSIWHVPGVELLSQFIDYLLLEDCVPFRSVGLLLLYYLIKVALRSVVVSWLACSVQKHN